MSRLGWSGNTWEVSAERVSLVRDSRIARVVEVGTDSQVVELDLSAAALIVVDMQNDFCSLGGWLDHIGVDVREPSGLVPKINRVTTALRTMEVPIIWLNWGNRADRANLPPGVLHVYNPDGESTGIGDPLPHSGSAVLQRGSWSAAPVDELVRADNDIRVDKYRMSGFHDTELDGILRNLHVTTVLFAGVNVDQCVYSTLIDAASLGYDVILLRDCSATTSPSFCSEATYYNVVQCFGFVACGVSIIEAINAKFGAGGRV
ncbi:MAG: cysteine hydrolase family protein [Ferrimicrobium sp.]|nr:isochorismatase family cysteine hydrolase [Ferrimicrobium sp.]MCL5973339.1 cysteine hydrolase [Actinomycetota bacterium]MDA8400183.1 cysteine hydrolase [Actinomycetota bacterium]